MTNKNSLDVNPIPIDPNAEEVLKLRYYVNKADGTKENSFDELCRRVARTIASAETLYSNDLENIAKIEKSVYKDMMEHKFLFNSPCLFSCGAGQINNVKFSNLLYKDIDTMSTEDYKYIYNNRDKTQMLFACFVIEVSDSLEGIFDSVKNAAIISKYGGGVGANFSNLREKTSTISGGTGGKASGPISFMETWNTMGSVVIQGGKRRAALMGMLNSNHPDIEDFIKCKAEDGKLQYFNVSVAIDDKFMNAVFNDEDYDLISPVSGKVARTVKARELWDKICTNAHKRGDPGIFFIDSANNDSLLQSMSDFKIHSTNPCVTGDTLVAVADGRNSITIKQLAEENKDIPVYCLDDEGNIDIKMMRNPRITGYDKDVYEILLDDGSKIKATPNHKFRLHDGNYKELRDLVSGDSLWLGEKKQMSFYESFETKTPDDNDEEFRKRHSEAAMTDEVKQKISDNSEEYYHTLVAGKLAKCQAQTDLKCIAVENSIYVEKYCEVCGKLFTVPFGRREISICSSECNGKKISKRLLGKPIPESTKATLELKKANVREAQTKVYSDLKFELGKDPMKKEWSAKCKELGISAEISRASSPFKNYNDLKEAAKSYNRKVVSITYVGKENVYNGTVDIYHNMCFVLSESNSNYLNIINCIQCGEQPLSNESSCNLGSINLAELVDTNKSIFKWDEFIDIIHRTIYYLDLVIDASTYPLDKIEHNTKLARPVGLGVMGLADAAILLGIKYGSDEFFEFSRKVASTLAGESLLASLNIGEAKGPFELWNAILDGDKISDVDEVAEAAKNSNKSLSELVNEKNARNLIRSFVKANKRLTNIDDCKALLNDLIKATTNEKTIESKLTSLVTALTYLVNKHEDSNEAVIQAFNVLFYFNKMNVGLRNSRRLSIAPTGTISLLLGTSSSIEPNFAYEWDRLVSVNEDEKQNFKYYHKLYSEENKTKGLLISAHDVEPLKHVEVVKCFAPYIDSAISKTVNLSEDATVDDVKTVYEECFKYKIKGITVYRDGSRAFQPIQKTEEKEDKKLAELDVTNESVVANDVAYTTGVKSRPQFMSGITTKSDSPFGSIYVTANFDELSAPFEIFVSAGKSGSISKSITEALSRVISLALRAGVNINDIIKTMNNISGSDPWVYDTLNGDDIVIRSIPDAIAKMLKDLMEYNRLRKNKNDIVLPVVKSESNKSGSFLNDKKEMLCPECGNVTVMEAGCQICYVCGFSPCR